MKTFFFAAVLVVCMGVGWAAEALQENRDLESTDDDELEARQLILPGLIGNTNGVSVTVGNAGFIALGALLLIPLIIGLALLFYLFGGPGGDTSSGYSSYGSTSHGRGIEKSFDPYAIDWEKFSILDWIAIGEETWRKFDPADLECQKRLICEVHQNTSRFGTTAARLVDLFSYLQYAEVLSLPDEIKALVEEYNDAADRGRSLQKDCGEVYTTCDFSVKTIIDKYSHNEI